MNQTFFVVAGLLLVVAVVLALKVAKAARKAVFMVMLLTSSGSFALTASLAPALTWAHDAWASRVGAPTSSTSANVHEASLIASFWQVDVVSVESSDTSGNVMLHARLTPTAAPVPCHAVLGLAPSLDCGGYSPPRRV